MKHRQHVMKSVDFVRHARSKNRRAVMKSCMNATPAKNAADFSIACTPIYALGIANPAHVRPENLCITHATLVMHAWHAIERTFRQKHVSKAYKKGGRSPLF